MPVKVKEHVEFVGSLDAGNKLLEMINFWVEFFVDTVIFAVQILPKHASATIAENHTVGIDHGHHHEDSLIADDCGGGIEKSPNHSPKHDGAVGLAGMDATNSKHHLLLVFWRVWVCYAQHRNF